ncbi:adenosylhomocysteinase [Klebsiella pneumoniae]|uniref:Adenosylhomocysteinase n=1 Tax=Klebsiella pneumoniae TaxID=573 RepID=A0A447RKL7_KLEPN|nr:adenosylhomocysteinase [Klebsiella pneumoniae]
MAWLVERGAEACAWRNMSDADWQQSWEKAIAWQPTHLCEMGADITTLLHQRGEFGNIVAGLEATGSGVNRLGDIQPGYPIFNWDDPAGQRGAAQPPYGRSHRLAHLLPDHSPHPA